MNIAVIGTGNVGRTLGEALTSAGHTVTYGSRGQEGSVAASLETAEAVIVAIPGDAVPSFAREHADALTGKVVVDATNTFGGGPLHSAAAFAPGTRYVRAFNALGWENFENPVFDGGVADLLFSCEESERETAETLIRDVGLNPVHLGAGQYDVLDGLFFLWFALVNSQGRGRHLAVKVLL
ncbi:NADPH-dependent F420 reductase [Nonomuraea soli]|uniref:Pyrroline-5-carboxylate reductase catalytic N-terminal domain-containing protein n=1 Tax=Nonomuraea soli TaxID=1032476 RepID=A0A7W0CI37_9ACTN|nr:NAD(P)-binding domain-containing protein [Nonomuraea soli]MBA2891606.1 hypothetical protein [Nonomuraea soli]